MALATTTSFNLDLQGLIRGGMQKAGILGAGEEPEAAEIAMGREFLDLLLKEWQTAGRYLRRVARASVALTASAAVAFPSDTIDVEFPCMVVLATSGRETEVQRMTLSDYQVISNKDQTGVPSQLLIERGVSVTGTLWPVPDLSQATTLNYIRRSLIVDTAAGTNADAHQRYLRTITLGLALEFAEWAGKSDAKIARLEARYMASKADVDSDNTERGDLTFVLGD
jgi:hypothetical protein